VEGKLDSGYRLSGTLADLLAEGYSALHETGELATARECFTAAAAEAAGDPKSLGLAALGLSGLWVQEHRSSVAAAQARAWRELALQRLDPASRLAQRLRMREIAEDEYTAGRPAEILGAVERSREFGDPVVLADALNLAHHCMLGPGHHDARIAVAEELLRVGAFTGRSIDTLLGLLWRTVDQFLAGDPHADRSMRELRDLLHERGHRAVHYIVDAMDVMLSIRSGDFDRAEQLAAECAAEGQATGDEDATGWYGAQLSAIRWYQGRTEEMAGMLDALLSSPTLATGNEAFVAAAAVVAAIVGDRPEAAAALRRLRRDGFATLPGSSTWMVSMFGALEAAVRLGDCEIAQEVYPLLVQFADRPVLASLAVACFGSAHFPLGNAARLLGDLETAIGHFRAAVHRNEVVGNAPARVLAQLALAAALGERGAAGDLKRAANIEESAGVELVRFGMARWRTNTSSLDPTYTQPRCVREGTEWLIRFHGRSVAVRDSVGIRYLATLLKHPGLQIAAVQLSGGAKTGADDSLHALLDSKAEAEYRARLETIRMAQDRADLDGDADRSAKLQQELEWLLSELRRARGLGGRDRQFPSDIERARTSVQKAIRRALLAIGERDAELGADLTACVATGTYCSFTAV
jgi:tetratricopeptide (TPR) repeat protein